MSSITNIYLHYATNLDSHYKTIDDYILEKKKKKMNNNNNNNNTEDNLLTGVKSSHDKYYDKFYNPSEKRLPIKPKYIEPLKTFLFRLSLLKSTVPIIKGIEVSRTLSS